jgi:outer membrane protein TolC
LQQTRELAALDARLAIAQLEQAEAAMAGSVGTAQQATRAYQIAEVRWREGISTQLELSESRILLEQAMANRAVAARNLQVARVRLTLLRDLPLGAGGSAASTPTGGGAGGSLPSSAGAAGGAGGTPTPTQQPPRATQASAGITGSGQ